MHVVYIFFIDINTKYLPCQSSSRHKYPLRHLIQSMGEVPAKYIKDL
jgi:hypothetical protein